MTTKSYIDEKVREFKKYWNRIESSLTTHMSGRKIWNVDAGGPENDEDTWSFVDEDLTEHFKIALQEAYSKGREDGYAGGLKRAIEMVDKETHAIWADILQKALSQEDK